MTRWPYLLDWKRKSEAYNIIAVIRPVKLWNILFWYQDRRNLIWNFSFHPSVFHHNYHRSSLQYGMEAAIVRIYWSCPRPSVGAQESTSDGTLSHSDITSHSVLATNLNWVKEGREIIIIQTKPFISRQWAVLNALSKQTWYSHFIIVHGWNIWLTGTL